MKKKVKIKKQNAKGRKEIIWLVLASVSMIIYIAWRILYTIPPHEIYGWLAAICGICLVVAEAIAGLEGMEHFVSLGKKTVPDMPEIPLDWYPEVDVFIATHNENTELLYKTINGCRHMHYPDLKKVHIFLCDDNARAEVGELAERMGIGYMPLSGNKQAKAGNLNNAIFKTHAPYIVTFDADMIPTHDFLMETIPYMFLPRMKQLDDGRWVERTEDELDPRYKIGFIQTPQSFYNPDLFQFNFFSEQRIPNEQDYFFRQINVGRNRSNAPIYAGSNTVLSREAIEEVGGISTGTITEDFETGIQIQKAGYTCYAIDKPLAHGLAPEDVDNLIKQRVRWGRGCISSLRRIHLLLTPHLKLRTKLSYISCWLYWWTFFRRLVFIAAPILFVLFRIPSVICTLPELLLIWLPSYLLYNHALKISSGNLRTQRWSNIVDTIIFPYMIIPILLETLFISEKKFHVTSKQRNTEEHSDLLLAVPHMLLLAADLVALVLSIVWAIRDHSYGSAIIIYWLAVNGLNLIMSIFFMLGRKNLRSNDRFTVNIPVEVVYRHKTYYGMTEDLSETGISFTLEHPEYLPDKDENIRIRLKDGEYEAVLNGRAVHVVQKEGDSWRYGIALDGIPDGPDKDAYFQLLYDRHHSLAKKMGKSVSIFEDVFVNIHRRAGRNKRSLRALPRVRLNLECRTADENTVYLVDCNYKYVLLRKEAIPLPETLAILIPGGRMLCSAVKDREGLYRVENWEELLFNGRFEALFEHVRQRDIQQKGLEKTVSANS